MPLTNYPNGVSSFGVPLIGSGPILTTGNVFFVNSTHPRASNGNVGTDPSSPWATINYAATRCVANNGDHIIVGPGHVETVSAAAGLRFAVAGISVIGIGRGNARPVINFAGAGADMDIDAASIFMENILFTGGIDALNSPIDVNATDFWLNNCEYRDVTGQVTFLIRTDNNADRFKLTNFRYVGDSASGTDTAIVLTGSDDVIIDGLFMDGNFATAGIQVVSAAITDLEIRNVMFRNRNAADIFLVDTITGSTGMIGPNIYMRANDNAANVTEMITGATFVVFDDVYVVNSANEKAMLINWTATTDA
jgi:hypothetical protein